MQQNCKKGLCLAFLFSAMFLTGWEIAGMRSRQTKETAAVAYEAGNWGLGFGAEGTQPTGNATSAELAQYDAHYVGDPSGKVLYLTFDCGYENGNTEPILDALKKHRRLPLSLWWDIFWRARRRLPSGWWRRDIRWGTIPIIIPICRRSRILPRSRKRWTTTPRFFPR